MEKYIYLDNAASTQVDENVISAMMPYLKNDYAVASSEFSHQCGIKSKDALNNAREIIARKIGAQSEEIIFTSGGTEANNLAIKGIAYAMKNKKRHLIVSKVEHYSVLNSAKHLEKDGFHISYIPVNKDGIIDIDKLKDEIQDNTFLVSIQHSNQETGVIQPISEISKICKEKGIIFHTDFAYSTGWIPINVQKIPVDLLTLTAHKMHGPKGIGALFVKKGIPIEKQMDGGYNEFNLRGGTENIPGAVGFAKAFTLMNDEEIERVRKLRDNLEKKLLSISDTQLNGNSAKKHPAVTDITFLFVEGESVVLHLDMRNIGVITGSACFSRSLEPSYVLMAMGFTHEEAHGSIRFSLGRFNSEEEIKYVVQQVDEVVNSLRKISPLGKKED